MGGDRIPEPSWHAERMQTESAPNVASLRRRSRSRWIAALFIIAAAAAVVGCNTLQRSLIYPARHYDHTEFERRVHERFAPDAVILAPFDAIVIEPSAPAVATAIWFHGNGNVNTDFARLAAAFDERRVRLVLAEYPGYGARAGIPSERVLVDDARALYVAIGDRYPTQPIVVIGQSLGSGVAAQLAADATRPQPQRLVLLTPFFDLPDAASHAFWNLPLQSIVNDRYDSGSALLRYAGPVIVVVAAEDRLIGAATGRRLAQVTRPLGSTTLVELAGADHNNWLTAMSPHTWDMVLDGMTHAAAGASRPLSSR